MDTELAVGGVDARHRGRLGAAVASRRSRSESTKLWSGEVVNLQVVESNEQAVQLRALVSARSSEQAWDLRCEVREKLIVFLQHTYPTALPNQRAELVEFERPRSAA